MTPDQAYATQLENALRAICDAAIHDSVQPLYCVDSVYINEARALLDGTGKPAGQEES
jgi:hypothetical protein